MKEWFKQSTAFEKLCALLFVFLATISCIATAQSLCLTLDFEGWVMYFVVFIVVMSAYIATSYGLKQIIDSQNDKYCKVKNIKIPERRSMFIKGLLIVGFFWILWSFPTNTHDMVFIKKAKEVAKAELGNQLSIFQNAAETTDLDIRRKFSNMEIILNDSVNSKKNQFDIEVTRRDRISLGPRAEKILNDIEETCYKERGSYFPINDYGTSPNEIKDCINWYNDKIEKLRGEALSHLRDSLEKTLNLYTERKVEFESFANDLSRVYTQLDEDKSSIWDFRKMAPSATLKEARTLIQKGYDNPAFRNEISKNVMILKNPSMEESNEKYENENVKKYKIYMMSRLYSVRELWIDDYFKGKLPSGFDMLTWILTSLLLDIAALLFSGIAFRGKVN